MNLRSEVESPSVWAGAAALGQQLQLDRAALLALFSAKAVDANPNPDPDPNPNPHPNPNPNPNPNPSPNPNQAAELQRLRAEGAELRAQMAALVGHQNHKQKIQCARPAVVVH